MCISQPLCIALSFIGSEMKERNENVLVKMGSHLYVTNCDLGGVF